jgi:hypothetical protein
MGSKSPLAKRTSFVWTEVLESVKSTFNVKHANPILAADGYEFSLARRQFLHFSNYVATHVFLFLVL